LNVSANASARPSSSLISPVSGSPEFASVPVTLLPRYFFLHGPNKLRVVQKEEGVNSLRPGWQQWLGHYRLHHQKSTYYTCVIVRQPGPGQGVKMDRKRPMNNTRRRCKCRVIADIMKTTIECVRERVIPDARTFVVKVKAHRGEPRCTHGKTKA
jgi:hypothetical protein